MPRKLFLFGMLLMAASIPLSVFGMSLAQFIMAGAWLLDKDYRTKLKLFYSNKASLLWCGFYGLHLLGSLWSSDTVYLANDLRIKLPMLLLPFLLSSFPALIKKYYLTVFKVFVLATAVSTFTSTGIWLEIIPYKKEITDIRQISIFISHIRLSLCVVFSCFLLLWFIRSHHQKKNYAFVIADAMLALWFIAFLFILESMTGMLILFSCMILVFAIQIFKYRNFKAGVAGLTILLFISAYSGYLIFQIYQHSFHPFDYSNINKEEKTKNGNEYQHCFDCDEMENSTPVYIYICEPELKEEWAKRSHLPYNGLDKQGHELKYTLLRYLASKGLRKDAEGVKALAEKDIAGIENGIANVNYNQKGSLMIRIHKTLAEIKLYQSGKNPSGSSLVQRFEFWKAGWSIFKDHWLIGTGTGDVKKAFHEKYIELDSSLDERWRLRAHNQYLTIALTFGIGGLLYFLLTFFYPVLKFRNPSVLFCIFLSISALSFLTEDTLETQAGITFVMFFMSLFISVKAHFHPLDNEGGKA
ncbi:MAG: O-antigen ligase family protein [Bacteroidia bacterium]|nr:O-antigen ligase family protein [Bacteroidia bacterium]